jgi:hypothetical protein
VPSSDPDINEVLDQLIDGWCDRRELGALARVLPAHRANNGLTDGWSDLLEALRTLRADRSLPGDEQRKVDQLVGAVERIVYRS